ncbi:MAG: hypothetical protein JWM11_5404, partial [Planctomycetaceae bacterium]|nr:hypothetical protein [Planctomycetaceae bacterium]
GKFDYGTDAGVLMCLDEKTGKVLYQYASPRLPRAEYLLDWPGASQCGSPLIEQDRLWFCNNRCEVICLDIGPLLTRTGKPKVVWKVDIRAEFGVVPRAVMIQSNASHCSVAGYQDLIYVNTTNSKGFKNVPAPNAPSLICFQKMDGKVKWKDSSPGNNLIDVQHGSPLVMQVSGNPQVIMGQGDGWMRGFDALTGEVLWKFDFNLKTLPQVKRMPFKGNNIVAMPVSHDGRVYFATGVHYELGEVPGRLCCIDPTKRGDISSEIIDSNGKVSPNPASGLFWEYLGANNRTPDLMHAALSSVVIHSGLVFAADTSGVLHCVDAKTGKGIWTHDFMSYPMSSPLIVGNKVYAGAESTFCIFELARQKKVLAEYELDFVLESGPVFANDVLYLMTRDKLTAIRER